MKRTTIENIKRGNIVIHVVGGNSSKEYMDDIPTLAKYFVDNNLTLLWGDEYLEKDNTHHVVAQLATEIKKLGGEKPVRILQIADDIRYIEDISTKNLDSNLLEFEEVLDKNGVLIGYLDPNTEDDIMIYTSKQQDRQKAYYDNTDALMVLDGAIGTGYEIVNAFIYRFSKDATPALPIYIADKNDKYYNFIQAYANLAENPSFNGYVKDELLKYCGNGINGMLDKIQPQKEII